jgi:hypothetical protein
VYDDNKGERVVHPLSDPFADRAVHKKDTWKEVQTGNIKNFFPLAFVSIRLIVAFHFIFVLIGVHILSLRRQIML